MEVVGGCTGSSWERRACSGGGGGLHGKWLGEASLQWGWRGLGCCCVDSLWGVAGCARQRLK